MLRALSEYFSILLDTLRYVVLDRASKHVYVPTTTCRPGSSLARRPLLIQKASPEDSSFAPVSRVYTMLLSLVSPHLGPNDIFDEWKQPATCLPLFQLLEFLTRVPVFPPPPFSLHKQRSSFQCLFRRVPDCFVARVIV